CTLDRTERTGTGQLLGGAIAHDDHLIDVLHVGLKNHLDLLLAADRTLLGSIPDAAENKDVPVAAHRYTEPAVLIGLSCLASAFFRNGYPRQGPLVVFNNAGDDRLGSQQEGRRDRNQK